MNSKQSAYLITTSYAIPVSTAYCTSSPRVWPFPAAIHRADRNETWDHHIPLWLVLQPGRWRKSWHLNRQCAVSRIKIVSASCLSRKHHGPPSSPAVLTAKPKIKLSKRIAAAHPELKQAVFSHTQMTIQKKQQKNKKVLGVTCETFPVNKLALSWIARIENNAYFCSN